MIKYFEISFPRWQIIWNMNCSRLSTRNWKAFGNGNYTKTRVLKCCISRWRGYVYRSVMSITGVLTDPSSLPFRSQRLQKDRLTFFLTRIFHFENVYWFYWLQAFKRSQFIFITFPKPFRGCVRMWKMGNTLRTHKSLNRSEVVLCAPWLGPPCSFSGVVSFRPVVFCPWVWLHNQFM